MRTVLAVGVGVIVGAASFAMAESKVVKVDGSSTVFPITEAVAEEFQKASRDTKVTVGISGTGGGFKKFVRGEIDISDASRPISAKEMADAKAAGIEYIELPIAFDALTVMVNPGNEWVKQLTVEDLKKIWEPGAQQKITRWNQVRSEWPDAELKLYGAGSDSGTFDYFTEAIVGKAKSSRGDYTASEDDNVLVQGISNDKNALGYFGYAYYAENQDKLKAVPVVNKEGKPVLPSEATVKDGSYNPLARPIFIYVNKKSLAEKAEVKAFVQFYLKNAPELVKEVKYVALPDAVYELAQKRLDEMKTGTVFGGKEAVGLKIEELFDRELKQ
ncbi:MAG: PstS family phosphate ABC transporter substrate-binding protein [Tepidisphaeraceae bacterium]